MVGASFSVAAAAQVLRAKASLVASGNAQISTAQSKFGGSSALFDGSGDYIDFSNVSSLASSDFTIEMWARFTAVPWGQEGGYVMLMSGLPEPYVLITRVGAGSQVELQWGGNGYAGFTKSGVNLSIDTWYHIAATRQSGVQKMFFNGTELTTFTNYSGFTNSGRTGEGRGSRIGMFGDTRGSMAGYLDEYRISNIARYTGDYTPPTAPFVNDANTLMLIHADGTNASTFFEDDNGGRSPRALIAQGNAQIDTAQSKFGGAALLCDGTGDYVMSPAGLQWDFGTSSFTIEYWIRFNVAPTLYVPIALRESGSILNGEWWCEITAAEKKMYWGFKNTAGTTFYVNLALAGTAFATGQFYHIALVNNAGTAQMYVNGTATGSTTSLSGSFGNSTTNMWIGAGAGAYSLNGWMDEVRISNSARYTSGFTPSTTPFVNDANTLLLLHADGTDAATVFRDDNGQGRSPKGISAIGNAKVSTAQSKFGGSSALFDGTGDALSTPNHPDFNLNNTANFTVEFWYRPAVISGYPGFIGSQQAGTTNGWLVNIDPSANVNWIHGTSVLTATSTGITTNNWYHIAVVRSNTTNLTIYINGVSKYNTTSYSGSTSVSTDVLRVGAGQGISTNWDGGTYSINGYLDEIRISNTDRYTAAFTPSTTPFQNDANTLLLLHSDGTNNSTVFVDDNGIAPYTP
jgi:hypothetical protein